MERGNYQQMSDDTLAQVVANELHVDHLTAALAGATNLAKEFQSERDALRTEVIRLREELVKAVVGPSTLNVYRYSPMIGIEVAGRMFKKPTSVVYVNSDELRVMVDCADNAEAWFHLTIGVPLLVRLTRQCLEERDDISNELYAELLAFESEHPF